MNRDNSIDSVAGIMILYMVFTHVCQHYHLEHSDIYMTLERLLYFFMPWFFFKAGMFFKVGNNKEVLIRSAKRLLKPFALYSLLGHMCYCVFVYFNGDIHLSTLIPYRSLLMTGSIPGNLPLWFLLSLFGCRVVFNTARNIGVTVYVIAIVSLLVACGLHFIGFDFPYYIANVISGLFFMSMGYMLCSRITPPILAISFIIYAISILFPSFVGMRSNHLYYGSYLNWYIYSLCGIIAVNFIVTKLTMLQNRPLRFVGRHSMEIYCLHWIPLIFI